MRRFSLAGSVRAGLAMLLAGAPGVACVAPALDSGQAGQDADAGIQVLVEPNKWRAMEADEDPLAEERPAEVDCPAGAWGEEDGVFEVETDLCNYGAFVQDSAVDVAAGEEVVVSFYHVELWSEDDDARAHVVLGLGDTQLAELWVDIPSDAETYEWTTAMPQDAPAGTPMWLHIHNHGYNSYRLVRVSTGNP